VNVVVDANVAVGWFVRESDSRAALASDTLDHNRERLAPDIVITEVLHTLHKKLGLNEITSEQGLAAVQTLSQYFERLVPSTQLAEQAWDIAVGSGHSFQDCLYLALALDTGARLATFDERLAKLASTYGIQRFRKKSRRR
jgi:predicted nucleic acid-binding protein